MKNRFFHDIVPFILLSTLLGCDIFGLSQFSIVLKDPQSLSETFSRVRVRLRGTNERIEYHDAGNCTLANGEECTFVISTGSNEGGEHMLWVETLDENDALIARSFNTLPNLSLATKVYVELAQACSGDTDCDDNKLCNGVEACSDEICIIETDISENTLCTTLGGQTGHCTDTVCLEATCGDGVLCNGDACISGPGNGKEECDDGNNDDGDGCNNDCSYSIIICSLDTEQTGKSCDDGNNCTLNDVCLEDGTCAGSDMTCNTPPDTCFETQGTCNAGQCVYEFLPDTLCDDNDACTGTELEPDQCAMVCDDDDNCTGACVAGGAITCDTPPGHEACFVAPAVCTNSACHYIQKAIGTDCSDTNLCDGDEQCDDDGACVEIESTALSCNTPPSICHTSAGATCAMNENIAECTYPEKTNGTSCANETLCDGREICTDGSCAAIDGTAITCPTSRPSCDTSTGACLCTGESCDDGLFCTGDEICNEIGRCERAPLTSCTTGISDSCQPSGCVNPNCNSALDVAFFGTCAEESNTCQYSVEETLCENQCGISIANQCHGVDPCTGKDCSSVPELAPFAECWAIPGTGASCVSGNCVYTFQEDTACDDGNFCTTDTKCICLDQSGDQTTCPASIYSNTDVVYTCGLGESIECDDENVCTLDYCDMNASETGSRCINTNLPAGAAGLCPDDQDPCTEDICNGSGACINESLGSSCGGE